MNTATAMNIVSNSPSSLFTKQDVLDILSKIESTPVEPQDKVITQNDIEDFIDYLSDQMSNLGSGDIVDFDSAEFSLNGNEIVLEDISINIDSVLNDLSSAVREYFKD
jgi:hypothetical protein